MVSERKLSPTSCELVCPCCGHNAFYIRDADAEAIPPLLSEKIDAQEKVDRAKEILRRAESRLLRAMVNYNQGTRR
jgi:hypothetical protein